MRTPMTTTISLHEATKAQLDEVLEDEGHTSQDSAVKALLLYRELYLQSQATRTSQTHTPSRTTEETQPPTHHNTNDHTAYIGDIGAGKTFTSKYHIHHQLEADDGNDVIIVDPLGCYTEFTTRHGGTNIEARDVVGDPFTFQTEHSVGPDNDLTWAKKVGVPFVVSVLTDRGYTITENDEDLLLGRLVDPYANAVTSSLSTVATVEGPALPTDVDRPVDQALGNAIADDDCAVLNTELAPEFPTDALVTISSADVSSKGNYTSLGAIIAAFAAGAAREETVDLYIDNSHYIMQNKTHREILLFLLRTGRHHGVYLNFISQSIEEFIDSPADSTLSPLDMIETMFLHQMDSVSDEARTAVALTEAEVAYIQEARVGNLEGYSEILVSTNGGWTPQRVEVSKDLQKLIDPNEY